MRLWGKGWMVGLVLLLGLTTTALAVQQKAFLWNGTHWSQVSFDGKAGYVFGVGNMADFESAASPESPCISRTFTDELKTKTVDQVIAEVDKFYKENPDKLQTTVIEVILQQCTKACPPGIKK
jgi:hypothetical protein